MNLTDNEKVALLGGSVAAVSLAGCGGGGGAAGTDEPVDYGPANTITALSVAVNADTDDTVTIEGAVTANHAKALDDVGATADPGRSGTARTYTFAVDLDDGVDTESHDIIVAINATPAQVLATIDVNHRQQVQHLLRRAGFGASLEELRHYKDMAYDDVVDDIVDGIRTTAVQTTPAWIDETQYSWEVRRSWSQADRDAHNERNRDLKKEARKWWYKEMVTTPSPLTERLVLFWHDLWTSNIDEVTYAQTMLRQNMLMRQYATNFRELAHRIPEDPAMVIWLDSDSNIKGEPNENFARELLELFTLGEGMDYDEDDIAEIARCFTGYGLTPDYFYEFDPENHDADPKTVFGQTGNFKGNDVVDMLLAKDRTAVYICENLWDEFIAGSRDTAQIAAWATILRDNDYDLKPVLKAILKSTAFTDPATRGLRVKSPVEMSVGIYRTFAVEPPNYGDWLWMHDQMGHDIMDPPSVQGWPHGTDWIDANTLVNRRDKLRRISWRMWSIVGDSVLDGLPDLLLSIPPVGPIDTSFFRAELRSVISDTAMNLA